MVTAGRFNARGDGPVFSKQLSQKVLQLSPENRAPGTFPLGRVLLAGDGETDREFTRELNATHEYYLRASEYRWRFIAKRAKKVVLAILPQKEI
jgi:chorismate-pyruvate lyase